MRKFTLKARVDICDIITGEIHKKGDEFEIEQEERVIDLSKKGAVDLVKISCGLKKKGSKIIIAHNYLAIIGGVERAELNLAKHFKDRNITFIFKTCELEPALELGKYCDVVISRDDEEFETDILILANFETDSALVKRIKSRKTYQQIHADWKGLKELAEWKNYQWKPNERVDKVLSVSETAQEGLRTAFGFPIDSTIVRNVFLAEKPNKTLIFLTLSRLSKEKGAKRTLEMVKKLEEAGRPFYWFISATPSHEGIEGELKRRNNVFFFPPSIKNVNLLPKVDYLVQLSDNESYGYSVREALANRVPVVVTRIPEFEKIVQDKVNGFILEKDLSNLDINALYETDFSKMPEYTEPVDPNWEKVFDGTIDAEKCEKTCKKPAKNVGKTCNKKKGKK